MKALDVLNPNPKSTLSGRLIFQVIFRSKHVIFPSTKKSQNWVEIKFQRNIWGQLDVRTRMRASKSWNFDLEKPIKPIKVDSCVIFADHCTTQWFHLNETILSELEGWPEHFRLDGRNKSK